MAAPKQGTDAAVAMAMGHVILKEFYWTGDRRSATSTSTRAATPTCRCWCCSREAPHLTAAPPWCPTAMYAPVTLTATWAWANHPDWKTVAYGLDGKGGAAQRLHRLSLGQGGPSRRGPVEPGGQGCAQRQRREAQASVLEDGAQAHAVADVAFPTSVACRRRISRPTTRVVT